MDYGKDTRLAYQTTDRARDYKEQYENYRWVKFTTRREHMLVEKALGQCGLKKSSTVLDLPCGTGVLAHVLAKFPFQSIGSDISREMMAQVIEQDGHINYEGLIQADVCKAPFKKDSFACIVVLGLMHRVPEDIRRKALQELTGLSNKYMIISYSVDNKFQQIKHWVKNRVLPEYTTALSAIPLSAIKREFDSCGLVIRNTYHVVYQLSSELLFLLEKRG